MEGSVEVERIIRMNVKGEGRIDISRRFVAHTLLYRTHSTRRHGKRCHVVVGSEPRTGRIPEFFEKGLALENREELAFVFNGVGREGSVETELVVAGEPKVSYNGGSACRKACSGWRVASSA
jgi:hypothetical protein